MNTVINGAENSNDWLGCFRTTTRVRGVGDIAMSQVMDFKQFMELVKHIEKDHSVHSYAGIKGKTIKYIRDIVSHYNRSV